MGVSAVFVSTLARARLPPLSDPPGDQREVLAGALQPVVACVVLGSIVVRASCLPFRVARLWLMMLQTGCPSPRCTTQAAHAPQG